MIPQQSPITEINPYLFILTEKTQHVRNPEPNKIVYSEVHEIYMTDSLRTAGVKYTIEGMETYRMGKKEFHVGTKHFFMASPTPGCSAYVSSRSEVKGICINIDPRTVQETYTILEAKNSVNLDNIAAGCVQTVDFFEDITPMSSSFLSRLLQQLENDFLIGKYELGYVNAEWFLLLAEAMISEQYPKLRCLNRLERIRRSTKKEILRRLLMAKEFIEENIHRKLSIAEVAQQCCMAEFHFFRCFRDAFGQTPLQYITARRMERSLDLLKKSNLSVYEAADLSGYADIHSFSKAFKKYHGYPPSTFIT